MSPLRKIDALELIGSAFILYCPNQAFRYGIPCLKEAFVLPQSIEDGQSGISNTVQPHSDHDSNAIRNTYEFAILEQLEQVSGDYHRLFIQAFKISQRNLTKMMIPGPHIYLLDSLEHYAYKCCRKSECERAVNVFQLILESLHPCKWENLTDEIRVLISRTLTSMYHKLFLWRQNLRKGSASMNVNKELFTSSVTIALEFAISKEINQLLELVKRRTETKNQSLNTSRFGR